MINTSKKNFEGNNHIQKINGKIFVPDFPVIPFIEGDGCGSDIWPAAKSLLDAAVSKAYSGARQIEWLEVFAGQKAFERFNQWLPEETLQAFQFYQIGMKGPLATPVGEGMRSLNVALRKALDLYVCLRPIRWFAGVPSPMRSPEKVNMTVFRENTEDIYTGIEFPADSVENQQFLNYIKTNFPLEFDKIRFPNECGINIKPISKQGSQRLVRSAIAWALENQRQSVTIVHKGNIMKYTEGAFRKWGYEVAENEFKDQVYTILQWERTRKTAGEEAANAERSAAKAAGKLIINDVITDAMFEKAITRPAELDVLATTNLNGDYLSDALAALVGGLGIAPGANLNSESGVAIFEATHGTAPDLVGKDAANPCSLILSGEMMLRYMGWNEAADRIIAAIEAMFAKKRFTFDLVHLSSDATVLKTSQFRDEMMRNIFA